MSQCVLQLLRLTNGQQTPYDDEYLVEYDPDTPSELPNGIPLQCTIVTTPDIKEARLFNDAGDALECWQQVSARKPVRPWDGRPNRPLTAFSVEIRKV